MYEQFSLKKQLFNVAYQTALFNGLRTHIKHLTTYILRPELTLEATAQFP